MHLRHSEHEDHGREREPAERDGLGVNREREVIEAVDEQRHGKREHLVERGHGLLAAGVA